VVVIPPGPVPLTDVVAVAVEVVIPVLVVIPPPEPPEPPVPPVVPDVSFVVTSLEHAPIAPTAIIPAAARKAQVLLRIAPPPRARRFPRGARGGAHLRGPGAASQAH
jgi:hypothetical protein